MAAWLAQPLLQPETWLILGLILVGLEILVDGSWAIFLPLGVASLVNGGLIYAHNTWLPGWMPGLALLDNWAATLLSYLVLAVIATIALRYYVRHRKIDNTPDINQY